MIKNCPERENKNKNVSSSREDYKEVFNSMEMFLQDELSTPLFYIAMIYESSDVIPFWYKPWNKFIFLRGFARFGLHYFLKNVGKTAHTNIYLFKTHCRSFNLFFFSIFENEKRQQARTKNFTPNFLFFFKEIYFSTFGVWFSRTNLSGDEAFFLCAVISMPCVYGKQLLVVILACPRCLQLKFCEIILDCIRFFSSHCITFRDISISSPCSAGYRLGSTIVNYMR